MKSLRLFSCALLGLAVTGGLRGQGQGSAGVDNQFLQEAANGGLLEVKLGKLASERAQNSEVRQFGQRMVTDHTKANQELTAVAEKNGVTISKELNQKNQAVYNKLSALMGAEFDRAYMRDMLKDHEGDVAEFAKESQGAQNPQVRAFAMKTLPVLQEHLRMARMISDRVK